MSDKNPDTKTAAESAASNDTELAKLVDTLSTGSRRERQQAAATIYAVAKIAPKKLVPHIEVLIDALNRPEGQTRWETLEALTILVDFDARTCSKAIPEAETALFDEESGPVRLGAMRFLCKLGSTTPTRSEKVWPLVDEGIQCYHGDLEFNDMLVALLDFSNGKLAPSVKTAFAQRMSFDAQNAKGTLGRRAKQIVENLS
ncbi:MAG TPA: hypothetical protein DCP91_12570 [Eggerthellaceae bacterium]|nr:hypothetical protein [Eggerthellaceae bacterium]